MRLDAVGINFQDIELLALSRRPALAGTKPAVGLLFTFTSYAPFTWSRQDNRAFEIRAGGARVELGQLEIVKARTAAETSREQLGVAIAADEFVRIFRDVVKGDEAEIRVGAFSFRLVREHVRGLRRLADELGK